MYLTFLVLFISSCGFKLTSGTISLQPDGLLLVFFYGCSVNDRFSVSLFIWKCLFCFHFWRIILLAIEILVDSLLSLLQLCHPIAFCPPQQSYWYSLGTWWVFLLLPWNFSLSKFSLSLHLSRIQLCFI